MEQRTKSPDNFTPTRPKYEMPTIKSMEQWEVLKAFQMSAAQISAAGCWWVAACTGTPCNTPPTNPG